MKERFLKFIREKIENKYPNYASDKIDEIMYGIESLYLSITKAIIIFALAFLLNIGKELIILLITFNIIRLFAFGMHANNSVICLIFSSIVFLTSAYLCKIVNLNNLHISIICAICLVLISVHAPADTIKRPLLKGNKRIKFKILSLITTIIFFTICILIKNNLFINCMVFGLIIECILISPITYKIFKMPYNNYKKYGLNT